VKFRSLVSQIGKPVSASEALSGRATSWIAKKFGVSDTTARRWRRGSQAPRSDRKSRVMATADRKQVAANALRNATRVNAGKVKVKPDTGKQKETPRNLGFVPLGTEGRERMAQAADRLEQDDYDGAASLVSDALLHSDGRDYGPLSITDYGPGFDLI
jgi:hypothetical protein